MAGLRLEMRDFRASGWRWVLTTDDGAFVADHVVVVDPESSEVDAFSDLDAYLRWHVAPDRRLEGEAAEVARLGAWAGEHLLGAVGEAMVERSPAAVRVVMPAEAAALRYWPFELGFVGGRPLAMQDVSLVYSLGVERGKKEPVSSRLRMLAVFSLPVGTSALALRYERYALSRMVDEVGGRYGRAIELRVLQYGVTRKRLGEALSEGEGWDVVHFSGHGLPAGLMLEEVDGTGDLLPSEELIKLLRPARARVKLASLSSCYSAAAVAAETLRLLGIEPPNEPGREDVAGDPLPALAEEIGRELRCGVLAMRYPVVDEFAVNLSRELYELLLGREQPLARAMQLALQRVVRDPPDPGTPPLSVATPALFGDAGDLRFELPAGAPLVFDQERLKMAGFPDEPERFVGRVDALAKATAALAPGSGSSGVLFHGMAGAGKTACALELAYRHQDECQVLVWWKAPDQGAEIATALAEFAQTLEAKVPQLPLLNRVDRVEELKAFCPTLTEFVERNRVLIVLDNLESLLTEQGAWRDERWQLLIGALADHNGLGRLVLTSRTPPAPLDRRVGVEAIHALSLEETVLLARELPNLGRLLRGDGIEPVQGRQLVARTLGVVQGHPELLRLADGEADDPVALEARLTQTEADSPALSPSAFFQRGKSTARPNDYLLILDSWTLRTATTLADAARTMFWFLAALEESDRDHDILDANWDDLWQRLDKDSPPPLDQALAPLLLKALIEQQGEGDLRYYRLHPAVAESGRSQSGTDFQTAVDHTLAVFWVALFTAAQGREREGAGGLVVRAGLHAAPYLLRLGSWERAGFILEQVLLRDDSLATINRVVPLFERIHEAANGTPAELVARGRLARALEQIRPDEAEALYRQTLEQAEQEEDWRAAGTTASQLVNLLHKSGRYNAALALIERSEDFRARAGAGPWTRLGDEGRRLQILNAQGHYQAVVDRIEQLRAEMDRLPQTVGDNESVFPWNIREGMFDTGRSAAIHLGKFEEALALNEEAFESQRAREAPVLELARRRFNDCAPLLGLNRTEEARRLLLACRDIFERENDLYHLGMAISVLADVEDERGHEAQAIALEGQALRYLYRAGEPLAIEGSHFNLANYLGREGKWDESLSHRLAAAVILSQTGAPLDNVLDALARDLETMPIGTALPSTFDAVAEVVERVDGVRFRELSQQLPEHPASAERAVSEILERARQIDPSDAWDVVGRLEQWQPQLELIAAAASGNEEATEAVERTLAELSSTKDWAELARRIRRVLAGERDATELAAGLDPVDAAIVQELLGRLGDAHP